MFLLSANGVFTLIKIGLLCIAGAMYCCYERLRNLIRYILNINQGAREPSSEEVATESTDKVNI